MNINREDITFPNILTSIRVLLAVVSVYLFFALHMERTVVLLALFASLLDYFDGWYARRFNSRTKLGVHLDPLADKVLVISIFLIIAYSVKWRWFYVLFGLIVAREVAITIYRAVQRRKSGTFLPASWMGKLKTVVQYVVGNSLLFYMFIYPGHSPNPSVYLVVLLLLVVFITVDSGLRYILPSCADGRKRSFTERIAQWLIAIAAREV